MAIMYKSIENSPEECLFTTITMVNNDPTDTMMIVATDLQNSGFVIDQDFFGVELRAGEENGYSEGTCGVSIPVVDNPPQALLDAVDAIYIARAPV